MSTIIDCMFILSTLKHPSWYHQQKIVCKWILDITGYLTFYFLSPCYMHASINKLPKFDEIFICWLPMYPVMLPSMGLIHSLKLYLKNIFFLTNHECTWYKTQEWNYSVINWNINSLFWNPKCIYLVYIYFRLAMRLDLRAEKLLDVLWLRNTVE